MDGTIDRLPLLIEEVKVVLKELKRAIDRYGIDMALEFRTQGATQYGTIIKSRLNSIITVTFGVEKGFLWQDENGKTAKLSLLNTHYGTGAASAMCELVARARMMCDDGEKVSRGCVLCQLHIGPPAGKNNKK